MSNKIIAALCCLVIITLFIPGSASASFTEVTTAGLTGVLHSSAAWGDYDNDGDLDVLLTGSDGANRISIVYRNNGGGTFTDISAGLTGVSGGSGVWGDYDNDGDLDVLLTGFDGVTSISMVYRNNGDDTFTDIAAGLTGVYDSSAVWGDYDNDGDLDILLTGGEGANYNSIIYRNNGGGVFSDISAGLIGVLLCSAAWGDYDNDGDLDILLTGYDGAGRISNVYRNNGDGTFTDISAGLPGVDGGSAAWGDYDNDGDLDVLLTGYDGANRISIIYRNNGDGTFTDISAGLTGVTSSSVAWGDFDNDGDLDILLTGDRSGSDRISVIYINNGDGTFSSTSAGLTGVNECSVAWGDYDNDGDLDILLSGNDGSNPITKIYRNEGFDANQPPAAPKGLIGTQEGATNYNLSWQAPASTTTAAQVKPAEKTPVAGLNYNLYVGTTSGGIEVASPMSDLTSGFRRIPLMGLVRGTTSMIKGLSANTLYYWSVQAIDTALAGGPFASEGCFRLNNQAPAVSDVTKTGASPMTFSEADFQGGFSDADSDAMAVVRIVTLPDDGQLLLSGQAVAANDEITASDLANLTYQAPDGAAAGQATFTWQGRDCTDWSADPAQMILNYTRDAGGGGGGGCFAEVAFDND